MMVKPIDDELLRDLWRTVAKDRMREAHEQPYDNNGDPTMRRLELENGAFRALDASNTLKLTAHWRDTGWSQRGKLARPTDAQGRGLNDMHMPSKWP